VDHRFREQLAPISDHDQGERYPDEGEEDAEDPSPVGRGHDVAVSFRMEINENFDKTGTISYRACKMQKRDQCQKLICCFFSKEQEINL